MASGTSIFWRQIYIGLLSVTKIPSYFPSHCLCCEILLNSFGIKGTYLRRWLVEQPSLDEVLAEFSVVFLWCKVNARRSVQSPRYHLIITIMITWLTWHSARNSDISWWHRHTNLKLYWAASNGSMDSRGIIKLWVKSPEEIVDGQEIHLK